jgi:hypothetical protein
MEPGTAEPQKTEAADVCRQHSPPYHEIVRATGPRSQDPADFIPPGAENFFELAGRCDCCGGIMVRSKTLPWTRFPKKRGGALGVSTGKGGWTNPIAFRNKAEVWKRVKLFLVDVGNGNPMAPNMSESSQTVRWEKFWYAVDMLYRWVTREEVLKNDTKCEFELEDNKVQLYTDFLLKCDTGCVVDAYKEAGLLEAESDSTWMLFRYYRNRDMPHLTKDVKDKLMNQLLDERRKVVDMFEKMAFLKQVAKFWMTQGSSIRQCIRQRPVENYNADYEFMYGRWVDYENLKFKRRQQQAAAQSATKLIFDAEVYTDQVEPAGAAGKRPLTETEDSKREEHLAAMAAKSREYREKKKKAKTDDEQSGKKTHYPPYNINYTGGFGGYGDQVKTCLGGATAFYKILGMCKCVGDCDAKLMVQCKCTPWTRFPTKDGVFDGALWNNPKNMRNCEQVRKDVRLFLTADGFHKTVDDGSGHRQVPELVPNFRGIENEARYEKFWYAVAMLYSWCLGQDFPQYLVDAWTKAFSKVTVALRMSLTETYTKAGLLGQETIDDWVRFRNCRDGDMTLTADAKDDLMRLLLVERRRVVDLFEKKHFLEKIVQNSATKNVISRLSDAERSRYDSDRTKLDAAKIRDQTAAAAEMAKIRLVEKADVTDLDAANILLTFARQASPALGDTSRAGGASNAGAVGGQSHATSVLLQRLERLALEEWC